MSTKEAIMMDKKDIFVIVIAAILVTGVSASFGFNSTESIAGEAIFSKWFGSWGLKTSSGVSCVDYERPLTQVHVADLKYSGITYPFEVELGDSPTVTFTSWVLGTEFERPLTDNGDGTYSADHRASGYSHSIEVDMNTMQMDIETSVGAFDTRTLYEEYHGILKYSGSDHSIVVDIDGLTVSIESPCLGTVIDRPLTQISDTSYSATWRESGITSSVLVDLDAMEITVPVCC